MLNSITYRRSPKRRGFSLLEVAIVVAIAGFVVSGLWFVASKVQRNVAINTATDQLYQIVENIRAIYISRPGIAVDGTALAGCGAANFHSRLSCQGAFPADMIQGGPGGFAFHGWDLATAGGSVLINPILIDFSAPAASLSSSFGVQFLNLPVDVCTVMASQNSVPDQAQNLKAVLFRDNLGAITNSFSSTDWAAVNGSPTLPVLPNLAAAACQNAAGGGATATVEWVFMLR